MRKIIDPTTLLNVYLPTTTISADFMSVWKKGASAETSHWYSPVNVRSTSVNTTLF